MKFNKKTDISIQVLKYLYDNSYFDNNFISANTISKDINLSYNHIRRIIPALSKLGFTSSRNGLQGGVSLTKGFENIPISKVLKEFDDVNLQICEICNYNESCKFNRHYYKANKLFISYFDNIYLKDL